MNPKEYLAISDAYKEVYAEKKEVDVKDTRRVVDAIRAYDKSKDASRDATYDTDKGNKKKGDKEKAYAAKERGEIKKDDPDWKNRKYHTGMHGEALVHAYHAMYGEDKKYGYDKDGNSLNPVDIEKKKRKEDDLFGSPKSHNKSTSQGQRMGGKSTIYKEESQAKQEIADLKKGAKTLKGKWIAKADKVEEDKNWIQKAVKRPGAFTAKATKHDMSVQGFAKYVDDNPKKFDTRTKRQANLAQTFASMKKEDMDEMIEIIGEVLLEG